MDNTSRTRIAISIIFAIYIFFLALIHFMDDFRFLMFKHYEGVSHNLIPLSTTIEYLKNINHYELDTWFMFIFGNIIAFIPIGILAPITFRKVKGYMHVLYITLLISISIELIQYISLMGVLDIDDVLKSVIGSTIGFYGAKIFIINKSS